MELKIKLVVIAALLALVVGGCYVLDQSDVSEAASPYSGYCGDEATYDFDVETGTLTISGTGAMGDYSPTGSPWHVYCSDILTIVIGENITRIGNYAFIECDRLASIAIPDSVESIGNYALANCIGLTSVTIPDSVTSIGKEVFYECAGLTSISVDSKNTNYISIEGVLFKKDKTELIQYPPGKIGSFVVPDSVKSIGAYAFKYNAGLTSIIIPDSVNNIGDGAFDGCTGLTSVTIGNSVTSIGDAAFYKCIGLTSIAIPDSVESIGRNAFYGCTGFASIAIPDSVESMGYGAFYGCTGLTSVTIGNGVATIDSYDFSISFFEKDGETEIIGAENLRGFTYNGTEGKLIRQNPTVTYNANKGTGSMASISIESGQTLNLPECTFEAPPTHGFLGWSLTKDGNELLSDSLVITHNTTIYAIWSKLYSYTINYLDEDGNVLHSPIKGEFVAGHVFNPTVLDFNGYVSPEEQPLTISEDETKNVRTYRYEFVIYSITFKDDSGERSKEYNIFTQSVEVPEITQRTGYSVQWPSFDLEHNSTQVVNAVYIPNPYTVKFDANGATVGEAPDDINASYDVNVTIPTNTFTRYGYSFKEWNTSDDGRGTAVSRTAINLAESGTVTLYAVWVPNDYEIVFDKNSEDATGTMENLDMVYDVEKAITEVGFEYEGYTFQGWATEPTGGVVYTNGQTVKNLTTIDGGSFTLYAVWEPIDYEIVFDKNSEDATGTMNNEYMVYDVEESLSEIGFELVGYTFSGWATSSDGDVVYTNGQSVKNLIAIDGGTVTLYAVWTPNDCTYTIKFVNEKGVEIATAVTGNADFGSEVAHDLPAVVGYTAPTKVTFTITVDGENVKTYTYTYVVYIITFKDNSGDRPVTYHIDDTITAPDVAVKTGYTGSWPTFTPNRTTDQEVVANYTLIYYKIRFVSPTETDERSIAYGDVIKAPDNNPTKESDELFNYVFSKWDRFVEGMTVTGDATFNAIFEAYIIVNADENGSYTVEASEESKINFDSEGINTIVESATSDSNVTLSVNVGNSTVVFDNEAIKKLNNSERAMMAITKLGKSDVDSNVWNIVGDDGALYDISFGNNSNFGNGFATVTLPYVLANGYDAKYLKVQYINNGSVQETLDCTYDNGMVTFKTNHFSMYAIVYEGPSDDSVDNSLILIMGIFAIVLVAAVAVVNVKKRESA